MRASHPSVPPRRFVHGAHATRRARAGRAGCPLRRRPQPQPRRGSAAAGGERGERTAAPRARFPRVHATAPSARAPRRTPCSPALAPGSEGLAAAAGQRSSGGRAGRGERTAAPRARFPRVHATAPSARAPRRTPCSPALAPGSEGLPPVSSLPCPTATATTLTTPRTPRALPPCPLPGALLAPGATPGPRPVPVFSCPRRARSAALPRQPQPRRGSAAAGGERGRADSGSPSPVPPCTPSPRLLLPALPPTSFVPCTFFLCFFFIFYRPSKMVPHGPKPGCTGCPHGPDCPGVVVPVLVFPHERSSMHTFCTSMHTFCTPFHRSGPRGSPLLGPTRGACRQHRILVVNGVRTSKRWACDDR